MDKQSAMQMMEENLLDGGDDDEDLMKQFEFNDKLLSFEEAMSNDQFQQSTIMGNDESTEQTNFENDEKYEIEDSEMLLLDIDPRKSSGLKKPTRISTSYAKKNSG